MKTRIFIYATKFENINTSGESLWKDKGEVQFIIELDPSVIDVASSTDYLVFTKMLEDKSTNTQKYVYFGHEFETLTMEILGTQQDYLDTVEEIVK